MTKVLVDIVCFVVVSDVLPQRLGICHCQFVLEP